jgi:PGDYG protein
MKTFSTFEEVQGMEPCMKRPIVVHAIQIQEDFRVDSLEGDYKQGKAGDYLMTGIDGEHYICDKDIFERTYDFV